MPSSKESLQATGRGVTFAKRSEAKGEKMAATQIQRVSHRHEAIIDFLLANPEVKDLHALCKMLNVSRSWLSIVMRSDAFRAAYTKRRDEYNQELAEGVQRKLFDTTLKALDKINNALEQDDLDPRYALDVADKTTNKLGFGAQKGNSPIVEVHQHNNQPVDKSLLKGARESMRRVFDVSPTAVPEEG